MDGIMGLWFSDVRKQANNRPKPKESRLERLRMFMRLHGTYSMKRNLAGETTDPEILSKLARECGLPRETPTLMSRPDMERYRIVLIVAKNPNARPAVLAELAEHQEWTVRLEAAKNKNCPPELAAKMIASCQIEKMRQSIFVLGSRPCSEEETHATRPEEYRYTYGFEEIVRAIKNHDPPKRRAIIEELKKCKLELAAELEQVVR